MRKGLVGIVMLAVFSSAAWAGQGSRCVDPFTPAATRHGVSPYLLAAIAQVESAHDPLILNVGGVPKRPDSRVDAVRMAMAADTNVDVGLMQVSLRYWKRPLDLNVYELLDPHVNVETGASILERIWVETGDLYESIGRYHSGDKRKGAKYAAEVWRTWVRRPSLMVCRD